jgi:hypothetical protein
MCLFFETEFYLATRNNQGHLRNWFEVARILMDDYNGQIGTADPSLALEDISESGITSKWCIRHESLGYGHEIRENNHIWCKPSLFRMNLLNRVFLANQNSQGD